MSTISRAARNTLGIGLLLAVLPTAHAEERYLTLAEVQAWSAAGKTKPSKIRAVALRDSALRVGAQAALAWRTRIYNDTLRRFDQELSATYDFRALLSHEGLVLPPVVVEARNTAVQDGDTLRVIRQTYRIDEPERLVSNAPTWQSFLLSADFPPPEKPPAMLLPQSTGEQAAWRLDTAEGWAEGLQQADRALKLRIARLRKAFVGRVLYLTLKLRGLVTDTEVKRTHQAIHSSGQELRIGEETITLARKAYLTRNARQWLALPQMPNAFVLNQGE